ncbi:MAG TPA: AAA family ATPase, partial [Anaerolineae bacterium]
MTRSQLTVPFLFLFGAPRIEREGKPVEIDTRKAFALLAYLAIKRTPQSRDALATLLWGDYDQTRARGALRRTLSVLNTALAGEQLEIDREAVGLAPHAKLTIDVHEFDKRVADCQTHGHPPTETCGRCITPLSEAAALYRDDFMAGFTLRDSPAFDEWQFFETETLRRKLANALEKLMRHHSAQHEYDAATVYARRWLALDPLHEPAHRYLIKLYAATGQRAAALRQYQECVRVLKEELGVQPLEETTRMYEILRTGGTEPEGPRASTQTATAVSRTPIFPQEYPLVGRAIEWAALLKAYTGISQNGQFIVLQGEAGIGKTRLAQALVEYAHGLGAVTISTRCYSGETNLAYGPFIEALRAAVDDSKHVEWLHRLPVHVIAQAARLLPELQMLRTGLPANEPLDSPGAQARFFDGISQVLLAIFRGGAPGILLIDDLQWIDPASLDLLAYIVPRLNGKPLCFLGTWRGDGHPANGRLRQLLAESQRAGLASVLNLARLTESAVTELVDSIPGIPHEIGERLYHETEGLAFFIVEYLATMR